MSLVGVVIPALNEEKTLPGILDDLQDVDLRLDIVVVDGGSDDRTPEVAREGGARVVHAPRGRAFQLNAGSEAASGDWLCFLHADVRMPEAARRAFEQLVQGERSEGAVWRFAIDARGAWFRLVEFGAFLRDTLGGLPYGDQGLILTRRVFEAVGGFPIVPIMEDVALVRAIRRWARLERLSAPLVASPRRWQREGPYRTWFSNIALISAYLAGVSPHRLARWRQSAASMTRVAFLAKAPRPGYVKTRLSAALGDRVAVDIYRRVGRQVVDQVAVGHKVTVWYAPRDARGEMRDWLGDHEYLPQPQGDLGHRLEIAFETHFGRGETPVVAIGADAPGVTASTISEAAEALQRADVAIGPALDGGYYLLALKRRCPGLLVGIPWGSTDVFQLTLAACKRRHYTVVELEPLRDLDTADDWLVLRRDRT